MAILSRDFHYAFRGLSKSPGFAVTAILTLTLALGIGAVTAVFSVMNSVLLRPYPFREANQLVVWRETIQKVSDRYPVLPDNYTDYLNLRTRSKTIADAAIFQNASFAVAQSQGHPQIVNGLNVSSNFFAVLVTVPAIGHLSSRRGSEGQEQHCRYHLVCVAAVWTTNLFNVALGLLKYRWFRQLLAIALPGDRFRSCHRTR